MQTKSAIVISSLNGLVHQGSHVDQLALMNGDRVHLASTVVLRYRS